MVARFFDGTDPNWSRDRTPRQELADWLTSPKNPYFAKNIANRMWAHFFGVGILDPVDEPGENNPPSHPELLDELGKAFADGEVRQPRPDPRHRPVAGVPAVEQDDAPDARPTRGGSPG